MNASSSPARILLGVFFLGLVLGVVRPTPSWAQDAVDTVILKNDTRRLGTVTGVSDGLVRLQIQAAAGTVQSTVPLAEVKSVNMQIPAALTEAEALAAQGKVGQARPQLEALVKNFAGLPASWVPRATLLLVDAQLETGDTDAAEATLVQFQRDYPDSAGSTGLIRAKIAIARNNYVGAKPLLAPIIAQAKETNLSDTSQSIQFGQAFYLMGLIREQEGDLSGALEDYLRTSVLFFADQQAATRAQERADVLIKEKGVVVP